MPQLMAIAEYVTKVHAICVVCGNIARYSYRLVPSQERVLLGETNSYEARCRRCFNLGDEAVPDVSFAVSETCKRADRYDRAPLVRSYRVSN